MQINKYIIDIDKFIKKNVINLTFSETISLIFHTIYTLKFQSDFNDDNIWQNIYLQFCGELEKQDSLKWPQITLLRNYSHECIHTLSSDKPFIDSTNILTLLLRLLFIEKYKYNNDLKYVSFGNILHHALDKINNDSVTFITINNLSIYGMFTLLEKQIEYYIKFYKNQSYLEYQLGIKILALVNELKNL